MLDLKRTNPEKEVSSCEDSGSESEGDQKSYKDLFKKRSAGMVKK
jgi:hypothetical protein